MTRRAWVVVLASLLFAAPASADGDGNNGAVAAQFFRAGRAAYERREYRAAALAFLEAYRRVPRSAAIYNAARSWEAAGELDQSADAFARSLVRGDLDADEATDAHDHLAALEANLAIADVTRPPGAHITIRGVDRGDVPSRVHVVPGHHEIHVRRRDGSDVMRSVDLAKAGDRVTVAFDDVPIVVPQPAPPPPLPPPPNRLRTYGAISFGVAGVLAGAGIYTFARFAGARSSFENGNSHDASLHDDAQRWRSGTYALWGGAVAFAILGGVLFFTPPAGDRPRTSAELAIGSGSVTFTLRE